MRRVLLIDDTPEIAELLTFALRERGYEVVAMIYTGEIGDQIRKLSVEAVVLDCSVYDMSESLFDALRDDPGFAELPVVIISDTPEQADASLQARNAQKVMLIPKPFTGAQIARALDGLLG